MSMYATLKDLCLCPSVSGREEKVREKIEKLIAPFCHELYTDKLGNLIALKKGKGNGKRVMLAAHMDEIGFLVTVIEDNGFIRIAPVGGISFSAAAYCGVVSEKGVRGTVVPEAKVKPEDYKTDTFYIDIGATSKKKAEAKKQRKEIKRNKQAERKMEILNMKEESRDKVHEMKKQKLGEKLEGKENLKAKQLVKEPILQKVKAKVQKPINAKSESKEPEKKIKEVTEPETEKTDDILEDAE